jgi:signal transduction histidine kinase
LKRLYVQIYLAFLAVGLLSLVVTACLASTLFDRPLHSPEAHLSAWEARERLPASERRTRRISFLALITAMAGTVAIGCWPIARRITRRLEHVKDGMGRWGDGALDVRVPVQGRDEVASVARTFNEAADRVQRSFDAQRRVLANASHELRSPLARLRMSLALLDDQDPERQALVRSAEKDIEELDATVSDILHVGRMQALRRPAQPQPVDLLALLREEGEKVGAHVEGPARVVSGDPRLLRRLTRNLFENARRHGAPPIEARTTPDGIEVCDRGPGIAEEHREVIFEPFWRPATHVEGLDGGVGLGLHLVREIARHHGGEVRVESREGGGSRFVVDLPT